MTATEWILAGAGAICSAIVLIHLVRRMFRGTNITDEPRFYVPTILERIQAAIDTKTGYKVDEIWLVRQGKPTRAGQVTMVLGNCKSTSKTTFQIAAAIKKKFYATDNHTTLDDLHKRVGVFLPTYQDRMSWIAKQPTRAHKRRFKYAINLGYAIV